MSLTESAGAAWATSATNTVTTGSYTPAAGTLQVAICVLGNGNNSTVASETISDSVSGTWTRLASAVVAAGAVAQVYCKDAGSSPVAQTVTFAVGAGNTTGIIVRQFTGAQPAGSQTGVTASSGSAAQASGSLSITPLTTGSQVVGGWGFSTSAVTPAANANTTNYGSLTGTNDAIASFEATALSTSGTAVSLGETQASGSNVLALAEILPFAVAASTGTGDEARHSTMKKLRMLGL